MENNEIQTVNTKEVHTITYKFTQQEMDEKAKRLAAACHDKATIEDQKKQVMSEFKYKLDGKEAEINSLSNHISNGYEMRTVSCDVEKDFKEGIKRVYYEGILHDTVKLNELDYQLQLEAEEEQNNDTTV